MVEQDGTLEAAEALVEETKASISESMVANTKRIAECELIVKQMNMYGMSREGMDEMIANEAHPLMGGHYMLAMSILSDAQECISIGLEDRARRYINRAKYVMRSWNEYDNNPKSDVGQTNQTI